MTLTLIEKTSAYAGDNETSPKERLANILKVEIARLWSNSPYRRENEIIEAKIANGIALSDLQRKQFIESERWNIEVLRQFIPDLLERLSADSPNLLADLVGEHSLRLASRGRDIKKFLITIDDDNRFFVDVFVFPPKSASVKHSHNAYCASFQVTGDLIENVYEPVGEFEERVYTRDKKVGLSTVVSPYDEDSDVHEITNNSPSETGATMHIYSQRVIGKDNIVKINHGNPNVVEGPTSNAKLFNAVKHPIIAYAGR